MESNSVCNHTNDYKIGRPRSGSLIRQSREWIQTIIERYEVLYQLIITITIYEKNKSIYVRKYLQ